MTKRRAESVTTETAEALADAQAEAPVSERAMPLAVNDKRDYRFKFRGNLFITPFLTIKGIRGGEREAKAELHRWLDAAIVSVESSGQADPKTLADVSPDAAMFSDASLLLLPEGTSVERDGLNWKVGLGNQTKVWRPGFSWHRVRMEIEQLRCALERSRRGEKPRLFAEGQPV